MNWHLRRNLAQVSTSSLFLLDINILYISFLYVKMEYYEIIFLLYFNFFSTFFVIISHFLFLLFFCSFFYPSHFFVKFQISFCKTAGFVVYFVELICLHIILRQNIIEFDNTKFPDFITQKFCYHVSFNINFL